MKKLYNEYFAIPKQGRIREKVMLARIAVSITIIIICLAAMSITAYAYFSYNITSGSNIIKAANFEADVFINITTEAGDTVTVTEQSNRTKTAELKAGNTYYVVLDESKSSTAGTGFVIMTAIGCEDTFHTQQLGNDTTAPNGYTDKVIFQLKPTADTTVAFLSHWGTSSYYDEYKKGEDDRLYITNKNINDNKILLIIDGISEEECDANLKNENEAGSDNADATLPDTEGVNQSEQNPHSDATGTGESETTTKPNGTTTEATPTQPTEQTTDLPTTEADK